MCWSIYARKRVICIYEENTALRNMKALLFLTLVKSTTEMYRMAREKGSCLFLSVVYLSLNPTNALIGFLWFPLTLWAPNRVNIKFNWHKPYKKDLKCDFLWVVGLLRNNPKKSLFKLSGSQRVLLNYIESVLASPWSLLKCSVSLFLFSWFLCPFLSNDSVFDQW